ncbi:MAG: hypothetical protein ACP5RT_02905 [Candidatus Micrarchaeia archaeon]
MAQNNTNTATQSNSTSTQSNASESDFTYIIIYFFTFLTGIIFYLISKSDKKKKQHSIQAIVLGVIMVILGLIPVISILNIAIWIYGLYIGYKASINEDVDMPYITDFAKKYV